MSNSNYIKTIVKTLNGEIFTVEYHKGTGEQGLKDAINAVKPEFYSDCQVLCYNKDNKDKEYKYVYVFVDTVENSIKIELSNDCIVYVCDLYDCDEYNVDIFTDYIESLYFDNSIIRGHCCSLINICWRSIHKPNSKTCFMNILYNPVMGLSSMNFMHNPHIEKFNDEFGLEKWVVPKTKNIWFPRFKDLKDNIKLVYPYIFSSEEFIRKLEESLLLYPKL